MRSEAPSLGQIPVDSHGTVALATWQTFASESRDDIISQRKVLQDAKDPPRWWCEPGKRARYPCTHCFWVNQTLGFCIQSEARQPQKITALPFDWRSLTGREYNQQQLGEGYQTAGISSRCQYSGSGVRQM